MRRISRDDILVRSVELTDKALFDKSEEAIASESVVKKIG